MADKHSNGLGYEEMTDNQLQVLCRNLLLPRSGSVQFNNTSRAIKMYVIRVKVTGVEANENGGSIARW